MASVKKRKFNLISITVPPEVEEEIIKICDDEMRSKSSFIAHCLKKELDKRGFKFNWGMYRIR